MIEQTFAEHECTPTASVLDALVWPEETAAWLAGCRVGPEAVTALSAIDPFSVPAAARIDLLVAAQRAQSWLAGIEQTILAAVACNPRPAGERSPDIVDPDKGHRRLVDAFA